MGVEVMESNLAIAVENGNDANMSVENGKVDIKFGSHVADEPAKGEVKKVSESNLPKDVVDEWPEPAQIHSFYVVRFRPLENQNLKAKLDVKDKEIQKKNQARSQILDKLKAKRTERSALISQLSSLSAENKQFRSIMDEKIKEMEPLQQALGKLRGGRERSSGICSSEEELNDLIKSLQYRIQHESIPLSEEKKILKEIKQLEGTREKVKANASERAKIQVSMGEKDAIQDQVKLIGVGLDGVRKEKQVIFARIKELDEEKKAVEKEISGLEAELTAITEMRDKVFENIRELRKQREDGNAPFYENRSLLTKAKQLAASKDLKALKELSDTEGEKFMSLWNSNKAFRDDYKSRILSSLDMRQLSKDGRMRNPDEKPLVAAEAPTSSEATIKTSGKPSKEDTLSPAQVSAPPEQKVPKAKTAKNQKEVSKKTENTVEKIDEEDEEVFTLGKSHGVSVPKKDEVDEKKLKEMKKAEEIAKRIQAEERKKKLVEKAAAKAAIKAQKEAEKKLKEREKRARKKKTGAAVSTESEEPTEAVAEASEPEKTEEKVETPVPQKNKDRKEKTIRQRGRQRGPDSLPKAILKRKKSTNYWMWAVPAACAVLVLLIGGFFYLK